MTNLFLFIVAFVAAFVAVQVIATRFLYRSPRISINRSNLFGGSDYQRAVEDENGETWIDRCLNVHPTPKERD